MVRGERPLEAIDRRGPSPLNDSGVVQEDVDAGRVGEDLFRQAANFGHGRQIGEKRPHRRAAGCLADFVLGFFGAGAVTRHKQEGGALLRELERRRASYSRRGAGEDYDFTCHDVYYQASPMKETERIAEQLRLAFYGKAWSGPAVMETVEGVTAAVAARKTIADAHSIWELVHHITAWMDIARRRAVGEQLEVTPEVNFPPVSGLDEAAWKRSLQKMRESEEQMRKTILQLSESRLDEPGVRDGVSVYILVHGAIQHSLYHAGQIMLLRK
jgi:hypothetical protein